MIGVKFRKVSIQLIVGVTRVSFAGVVVNSNNPVRVIRE
jgi:hypothetical protein